MHHLPFSVLARGLRAAVLPAALCLAAGGAQAQLITGVLQLTTTTLDNLTEALLVTSPTTYALHRDTRVTAADGPACRAQARHRGMQRQSYGSGSPRHRQLHNDCSLMGADTTAP